MVSGNGRRGAAKHALLPGATVTITTSSSAATSFTGWISGRCCISTFDPAPTSRSRPNRSVATRSLSSESCTAGSIAGSRDSSKSRRTRALLQRDADERRAARRSVRRRRGEELYQASMGIYVFNRDVLVQCLDERSGRFRQAHHSAGDQGAARQRLHLPGLSVDQRPALRARK